MRLLDLQDRFMIFQSLVNYLRYLKIGPTTILVNKLLIYREDFTVTSRSQKIKLCCSIYSPVYLKDKPRPCVIYLHGNSSSRLESSCYANMLA